MSTSPSRSLQSYRNDAFQHRAHCRCGHVFNEHDHLYSMPHRVGKEYLVNFRTGPQMLYFHCSACGHTTMYEHAWIEPLLALPAPAPQPDDSMTRVAELLGMEVKVSASRTGLLLVPKKENIT